MITQEQADEIREHLIAELNANGFSGIVAEINTSLEEDYGEDNFNRNSRNLLDFFLSEGMELLENVSNRNFDGLLSRINQSVSGETKVETIVVELIGTGETGYYDLRNLPDYSNISSVFREIRQEINREN